MAQNNSSSKEKAKPLHLPEYCKGCKRCIEACAKGCIAAGKDINSISGLVPVVMNLENCIACGLCVSSCPEPYALSVNNVQASNLTSSNQSKQSSTTADSSRLTKARNIPNEVIPLPELGGPIIVKGNYASAIGAILAGCRHFYGYPITPSTEGAELMAKLLPKLEGVFFQAVSEVATVNLMYGTGGAGLPCMTFTSSPGFSLMLEGISYMIGAQVPGVFVNVMRGGPGLGNIAPEQADIKLLCRGLGHGHTHSIVLAPSTPQEMLDLTILAFELSFKYRNPVMIAADGYLGQMTGRVVLPKTMNKPGIPDWAVYGDNEHRGNLICSIYLTEQELEKHNELLTQKYQQMTQNEQLADLYMCSEDNPPEVLLVAVNTPAQMSKGAVAVLREKNIKAGLFRPMTLWPFPINKLKSILKKDKGVRHIVVVEASAGQLEDELRLALNKAEINHPPISFVRRGGGILPSGHEIVEKITSIMGVRHE